MLTGLICKIFHKKEVNLEDAVNAIKAVLEAIAVILSLLAGPVFFVYWIYVEIVYGIDQWDLSWGGLTAPLGVLGALFTALEAYVIIEEYYQKHKKDIIAVCPKIKNTEEQQKSE